MGGCLLGARFAATGSGHRPFMSNPSGEEPIENANEADVAEQAQEVDGTVDEDAYPHQAEEDAADE